jgi:hypothetical protein
MRDELRATLPGLQAEPGQVLDATLISDVVRGEVVDLENVLLYNLESSRALAASCRHGLRLERVFASPTGSRFPQADHLHLYELGAEEAGFRHWAEFRRLAEWDWVEVPRWSDTRTYLSEIWWRLRHADEVRLLAAPSAQPLPAFSIKLELEADSINAAVLVKKATDAVCAAFQFDPIAIGAPIGAILASQIGEGPETIEAVLAAGERAVLGAKPGLVVKRGASVQWHPSDHLIVALQLILRDRVGPSWRMRGEIADVRTSAQP